MFVRVSIGNLVSRVISSQTGKSEFISILAASH